jgi:hypothetical protein
MLVGALLGFGAMLVLGRNPATRLVAGLMFPVVAGAWMLSMVLAIIGLVQGRKRSSRSGDGKTIAIITLVFGALFGAVVILPLSVAGLKGGINAARRGKQMRAGSEDLKFTARNFLFRTPGMPWRQVDARNFGNGPVLALARPEPMYFTVVANQLKPGIPNPMPTIVELSKANVRSMATSYQLLREGEVTVGKMAGWQTEAEASIQGHEYFMVHWLFAADGFGYQLAVWGPKEMAAGINAESERLFEGFQLTHGEE